MKNGIDNVIIARQIKKGTEGSIFSFIFRWEIKKRMAASIKTLKVQITATPLIPNLCIINNKNKM